jgi:hypothetical protein
MSIDPNWRKILAGLIPGMSAKFLAGIAIAAGVMRVVVALKQAVLLDDPRHLRAHIRPDDSRGDFRVIVRRQFIAHIVNERGDDEFVIRPIAQRPGRGLQGVSQTAHRVSGQRMVQFLKRGQQ